jgi:hypothetical protein
MFRGPWNLDGLTSVKITAEETRFRHFMICIRFCPCEGCDISGTPVELRAIADGITVLSHASSGSVSFIADTSHPPAPYPALLSALEVRVGPGPVCAKVHDGVLSVTAASKFLVPLSSFFQFEKTVSDGYHCHHEYFPGNAYISADSVPLIITVRQCHPIA